MKEAKANNELFMIFYYSFKKERVIPLEFPTEETAKETYSKIKEAPKLLTYGDAILFSRNYGADRNIGLLRKTFRDERKQLKEAMASSYE